jgi:hypothetical protein
LEYTLVQQDMKMKKFRKCVRFSDFEVVESMRHQSQQQMQQNSGLEEAALSMRKDAMQQGEEEHEDEIDEVHNKQRKREHVPGEFGKMRRAAMMRITFKSLRWRNKRLRRMTNSVNQQEKEHPEEHNEGQQAEEHHQAEQAEEDEEDEGNDGHSLQWWTVEALEEVTRKEKNEIRMRLLKVLHHRIDEMKMNRAGPKRMRLMRMVWRKAAWWRRGNGRVRPFMRRCSTLPKEVRRQMMNMVRSGMGRRSWHHAGLRQ